MRQAMLTLFVIAAGALTLTFAAGQDLNARTMGAQVTTLLETDVAGVEGKEWNVITVELTPGAMDALHSYPGVELVYVLEGAGFLEVAGKPPVALSPGAVAALHPKHSHVLKNTSRTQPLKVLVVLLLDKGQQRLMFAKRGLPRHQEGLEQIPYVNGTHRKTNEQNDSTRQGLVF